jgi:inorganic pyrophosphatase
MATRCSELSGARVPIERSLRMKHAGRHAVLSETATFDAEKNLRVVVETPKGSQVKYAYEPDCDCFVLRTVLPTGMTFPFDFGFVPSTLAEDGDPVDVLVLTDFAVVPGCILTARLIGVMESEQKEKEEDWIRNDRLIAVATHARTHQGAVSLKDLRPRLLDEIAAFFIDYNRLHDKKFRRLADAGPRKALELVEVGQKRFAKRKQK